MSVHPEAAQGALVGAVLCGGASRRMGRDKALLPVDGVPMAARLASTLRLAGCAQVVAIGGAAEPLADLGLDVVADLHPGEGPLGGVISALEQFPDATAVVVVACDLPWLSSESVAAVLAALAADVLAVVGRTDRVQPLVGAWRPATLPILVARFTSGERRLRAVLEELGVVSVDLPPGELANVNTPDDLRQ